MSIRPPLADKTALTALANSLLTKPRTFAFLSPRTPAQRKNIDLLNSGSAVVACTGQQVGVYLGPFFTLIKIASVIALSKELTSELKRPVVPVFWCQSEDHDYEEITELNLLIPEGDILNVRAMLEAKSKSPVAYRTFAEQIVELNDLLEQHYGRFREGESFRCAIRNAYRPGVSPNAAFSQLLQEVFGDSGLLLFDPLADECREFYSNALRPILRLSLEKRALFEDLLLKEERKLLSNGESPQVHVKAGSPLFFYHQTDGSRTRLLALNENTFTPGDGSSLSIDSLLNRIETSPLSFSTSALLRPIVQDSIFPTLVYVGGEAEMRYHLQLDKVYDELSIRPPTLAERAHVTLLDERSERLLAEMQLRTEDFKLPHSELVKRFAPTLGVANLEKERTELIQRLFAEYRNQILTVSPTLEKPLKKGEEQVHEIFRSLESKYAKAVLEREGVTLKRLEVLRNSLYPRGLPQERFIAAVSFLSRYGPNMLEAIATSLRPFSSDWRNVSLSRPD